MDFLIFDERTWPLDNPEEISAGSALRYVGRWRFGDDWDKIIKDIATPNLEPLPEQIKAKQSDIARAWRLLPESAWRQPPTITTKYGTSIYLGPQQYQNAVDIISERNARYLIALHHIGVAKLEIRERCLQGHIAAYAQMYNGLPLELGIHLWKTDRFHRWFQTGRVSMLEATEDWRGGDEPALWLFFNRSQMARAFPQADDKSTDPAASGKPDRSPKKRVDPAKLKAWASSYFASFQEPHSPSRDEAEAAFLREFPKHSTDQFRNDAWPLRPCLMPRSHRE